MPILTFWNFYSVHIFQSDKQRSKDIYHIPAKRSSDHIYHIPAERNINSIYHTPGERRSDHIYQIPGERSNEGVYQKPGDGECHEYISLDIPGIKTFGDDTHKTITNKTSKRCLLIFVVVEALMIVLLGILLVILLVLRPGKVANP